MSRLWLAGLLRHRAPRLAGIAAGVAVAVALIAALGTFLTASRSTMTARATRSVAVDWQVQLSPGASQARVLDAVRATGAQAALPVRLAQTTGLTATAAGATQTTGAGVVLGLPAGYASTFPGEIRQLAGASSGVLLAQQTAANLHATTGTAITVARPGAGPVTLRVAGVVDLPQADSLFQRVGSTAQPTAPPDNVVLLDQASFDRLWGSPAVRTAAAVTTQVHVRRGQPLPTAPAAAYTEVIGAAKNLEARLNGAVTIGDNLGSALAAARQDAAYAQLLFLFLGVPGAVVAALVTAAVAGAGTGRRRREQGLLRTRGLSARQVIGLTVVESAVVGIAGTAVGLLAAQLWARQAAGSGGIGGAAGGGQSVPLGWAALAAAAGLLVSGLTVALPAARDLRVRTVLDLRAHVRPDRSPRWMRWGLDFALLTAALLVFRATASNGYSLVLAPEGVPAISVDYWGFLAPTFLWLGGLLLIWRVGILVLRRGRAALTAASRPLSGRLAVSTGAGLSRNRRPLVRSIVLLAAAVSFAASTAVFNATYQQQAGADAQLTNGADVAVTVSPGTVVHPAAAAGLTGTPGVRRVEPLQHRLAYVGNDLQDLYGIRPDTIGSATTLQNTYFQGATAREVLATLARTPDGVLVSAETVKDYQLHLGDTVNLRLQDGPTGSRRAVPFRYVGVVNEFPTAPRDSFFVTNAAYVTRMSGSDAVGTFLVDTGGRNQPAVAAALQARLGTTAAVTDLTQVRGTIGSSLTAVDLRSLTRIELAFAVLLAAAAGGLVLALELAERRRSQAIARVLGATRRQLRGSLLVEALVVGIGGLGTGALLSWALSAMIVKVLTGVFDPPPDSLAVPAGYLGATAAAVALVLAGAAVLASRTSGRPPVEELREL
jgi:putative ABC transport system permease protein